MYIFLEHQEISSLELLCSNISAQIKRNIQVKKSACTVFNILYVTIYLTQYIKYT